MKTLLVNYTDAEGGAAKAAFRVHEGLRSVGVDSRMFVMSRTSDDPSVISFRSPYKKVLSKVSPYIDALPVVFLYRPSTKPVWSINWFPNNIYPCIEKDNADVIHFHWIGGGFVNLRLLKRITRPIVWTLHDMWAFTGGCHYAGDCTRYEAACGLCPQLESRFRMDLSRYSHREKKKAYSSVKNLTVVTPSKWLADCARKSSLLMDTRIDIIPNGIDHTFYRPLEKNTARQLLGLSRDAKLILFGAVSATSDRRKGFHLLVPALRELSGKMKNVELTVFGASPPQEPIDFGFQANFVGNLHDDISLALLYCAADVLVVPSIQDNFPNLVLEAMACGTPVVGFSIGGIPDIIEHKRTGYLAEPFEPEDLARGIEWVLSDEDRRMELSRRSRSKVEKEYTLEVCARRYLELYQDVLGN